MDLPKYLILFNNTIICSGIEHSFFVMRNPFCNKALSLHSGRASFYNFIFQFYPNLSVSAKIEHLVYKSKKL